jgi:NAD(P)-dependent dehydrogenase (short-subunit alcohol dehydrogenase family)
LTDTTAMPRAVNAVIERFGGLDILVNDAGIMFERTVGELRPDGWRQMLAVNLKAPLLLAQAVAPHMMRRGGGSIINIGSIEGVSANPSHAPTAPQRPASTE